MLAKSVDAKVRPLANTSLEKSSLLGAARIYVSKDTLLSLNGNLENGKHCVVTRLGASAKEDAPQEELQREASLWILPEKNLSPNVVMMTRAFQEATGFKIGDAVRITVAGTTPAAEEIVVQDVTEKTEKTASEFERMERLEKNDKYPFFWEHALLCAFDRADLVFPGMVVEGIHSSKARRNFKVISVNSQINSLAKISTSTPSIIITDTNSTKIADLDAQNRGDLVVTGVPGLSKQIDTLNEFLLLITQPCQVKGDKMSAGFVIHGGRGTGKTFILNRIAATKWGRVHWVKPSDKIASIRETFKLAQSQQPSIVLMDNFESLISKDRSNRDTVVETIGDELDALSDISQSNNAYAQVVVIATCSDFYTDIPEELRSSTRFLQHTPLPIPRTHERQEILEYLDPPIKGDKQALLLELAQMTHAYSPKDLSILIQNAISSRKIQLLKAGADPAEEYSLEKSDLERARKAVRPTAMRDINLNPPTIHWQDVGGQDILKKALNRMIKYTKNPEHSLRPPPKGLLLYGPPGCSKTLSAQAAATESGFNFFAVKGAELLNMYVGESERAVRTLFERARNASPSIIFFDEIDSIGGQRSGSGSATRSTGSVNMLTTLLTEMDGFEALSGVLILAATNRPEAMDSALMRPGRFDQVLYVGPPDGAAREAIFKVHLRGLPLSPDVDTSELARLAEGYSGAEIKAICNETCMLVQERYDDDPTGHKLEMTMTDLTAVLEKTPRNITKQMIDGYDKWSKQFKKV
ncbi:AAA family ATPase [Fusarium beomiforme]|uniref:AAA family ATPase n=1 Tax=Fusarium beomiforme TaxID=44412 RepID=A0A9P5DSP0_9HYPO|nr:AAA family ATPase [Fusarium beomiforme]